MEKGEVIDAVRDFIESEGYHYEYDAEREFLRMGFKVDCKLQHIDVIVDFHPAGLLVYAISPISASEENFAEMCKYLSKVNYALVNGNFEMNPESGEVRYKCWALTSVLDSLPNGLVRDCISVAYNMMKHYGDGVAAIALGFSDADSEIEKAEAQQDDEGGE